MLSDAELEQKLRESIQGFRLPRYQEIPDVGLFLEQTVRLVNGYLRPLGGIELTPSMVSNYVKQKLLPPPVKKQYGREQLAYLIFMAAAKTVLPLEDIRLLFALQREHYEPETAYNYFCDEFENVLQFIFGSKPALEQVGVSRSPVKALLRTMILTTAHRIRLDKFLEELREEL